MPDGEVHAMTHCTLHLDHFVDCQNQFWPPIGALWQ